MEACKAQLQEVTALWEEKHGEATAALQEARANWQREQGNVNSLEVQLAMTREALEGELASLQEAWGEERQRRSENRALTAPEIAGAMSEWREEREILTKKLEELEVSEVKSHMEVTQPEPLMLMMWITAHSLA